MITIYNFNRGARGVRVCWVCEEMRLAYRRETVTYPPSAAYLALNPLGSVPFLQDEGGVAITESIAMMLYVAERYGPTPLLPAKTDPTLAKVLQLTLFGEATLGACINPLIMAKFGAPEPDMDNWLVRTLELRTEEAIATLVRALGGGPFLAGSNFTLADISVSCALDMWKGALGKAVPDTLGGWRERVQARPAYQRALAAQS